MQWVYGGMILLLFGVLLRRLLRMDKSSTSPTESFSSLPRECQETYLNVARELETQTSMLAISLNEAFQERTAKRHEIAWRLVQLSASEWRRVAEFSEALLGTMAKYAADVDIQVPTHSIVARRFRSPLMIDYVRLHELLDQLVFRSKLRFQLHIRVLRRAAATLTAEFRRVCRYLEQMREDSEEDWNQLDLYFHDFDLITKETLLASRALLVSLSGPARDEFVAALKNITDRGVRSTNLQVNP